MEEGLGYLLGILFVAGIALYLAFLLASLAGIVAIAVVAIVSISGAASGMFIGVKNFYETFMSSQQSSKVKPSNPDIKIYISRLYIQQPAFLMYPYDAGWYVMQRVLYDVWTPTNSDAKGWFSKGEEFWSDARSASNYAKKLFYWSAAIGMFVGGVFHYIAAFFIVGVFAFIQSIFLVSACIVTSILIMLLAIGNFIYSRYYRIYHRCPDCHHQMSIPVHICPNCSTEHTRLWPSAYGVFRHKCEGSLAHGTICNELLPTIGSNKKKLVQKCPNCGRVLEGLGGTNIHIPIVGGPAVGKSHYIVAATKGLIEKHAPSVGWNVKLPDTNHRRNYELCVNKITSGQRLVKTSEADASAKAFNLEIQKPKQPVPKLLYLYDAAGEYYTSDSSAQQQDYFKYVHGVLLIIDPFSIENVQNAYKSQLEEDKNSGGIISPSQDNLETVYENMLMLFETKLNLKRNQRIRAPIAVVVTKCDAFDLEERIGETAARQYMLDHPKDKIRNQEDAMDKVVEEFLIDSGAGNFVRNLRNHFSKARFFSCSAVGIGNNSKVATSFEGLRVLDPLLWLLRQTA
jgi:Double-GTPase 2